MILRVIFGSFLAASFCVGQAQNQLPPVALDRILQGIENPDLADVPDITAVVQMQGIAFDLGQEELRAILAAGNKGKRNPVEMAAFIETCWNVCQRCQARLLAPLSMEELLAKLKRVHDNDLLLQEVKARQVKDLDIRDGSTANVLRAYGANDALVALLVPDDKVPTIPLIGYNTLELKHAEEYDPAAPEGWLKVTAEFPAKSTTEFVFKHNALFVRALTGGAPVNVGAYFNKPAPRNIPIERLDLTSSLDGAEVSGSDEKGSGLRGAAKGKPKDQKKKDAPALEVAYLGGDNEGRHSFQIRLANNQSTPEEHSFMVRWRVLTSPKAPAPTLTKPGRPAKK